MTLSDGNMQVKLKVNASSIGPGNINQDTGLQRIEPTKTFKRSGADMTR